MIQQSNDTRTSEVSDLLTTSWFVSLRSTSWRKTWMSPTARTEVVSCFRETSKPSLDRRNVTHLLVDFVMCCVTITRLKRTMVAFFRVDRSEINRSQAHPYFIDKIIQFYECHLVRLGSNTQVLALVMGSDRRRSSFSTLDFKSQTDRGR